MRVWLGLGSNLGDSPATLEWAVRELASRYDLEAVADLLVTAPQDFLDQPPFYNTVVRLGMESEGLVTLESLHRYCQDLERRRHRLRDVPKGPRTLDIDLIVSDWGPVLTPALVMPHPRLAFRRFVLDPLVGLDPELSIPGLGKVVRLLEALEGQGIYARYESRYTHGSPWMEPLWNRPVDPGGTTLPSI